MMAPAIWKNKIPALLRERGVSLSDLQRQTGMSYTGIFRLASEKRATPIINDETQVGTLKKIADVLGVDFTDLFEEVNK